MPSRPPQPDQPRIDQPRFEAAEQLVDYIPLTRPVQRMVLLAALLAVVAVLLAAALLI